MNRRVAENAERARESAHAKDCFPNLFPDMKKARTNRAFQYPQGESNPCSPAENRLS